MSSPNTNDSGGGYIRSARIYTTIVFFKVRRGRWLRPWNRASLKSIYNARTKQVKVLRRRRRRPTSRWWLTSLTLPSSTMSLPCIFQFFLSFVFKLRNLKFLERHSFDEGWLTSQQVVFNNSPPSLSLSFSCVHAQDGKILIGMIVSLVSLVRATEGS